MLKFIILCIKKVNYNSILFIKICFIQMDFKRVIDSQSFSQYLILGNIYIHLCEIIKQNNISRFICITT